MVQIVPGNPRSHSGTKVAATMAATVVVAVFAVPVGSAVIHAAGARPTYSAFTLAAADVTQTLPSTIPGTRPDATPRFGRDAPLSPAGRRNLWAGSVRAADAEEAALRIKALPLPVAPATQGAPGAGVSGAGVPGMGVSGAGAPGVPSDPPPSSSIWARAARLLNPRVPAKRVTALKVALTTMGTPYVWGGAGTGGFDCSGLVQWAYRKAGILVPRTSRAQSVFGTPIARNDLRPGDLVFFYSPVHHVGIYLGSGNVLPAPQTGDVVKISPLRNMPLSGARRI